MFELSQKVVQGDLIFLSLAPSQKIYSSNVNSASLNEPEEVFTGSRSATFKMLWADFASFASYLLGGLHVLDAEIAVGMTVMCFWNHT